MTAIGRALAGAAVGGFVALSLHPATRPLLHSLANQPASVLPSVDETLRSSLGGASRDSTVGASIDAVRYADQRLQGKKSDAKALEAIRARIAGAQAAEPDNAFWPQMLACIDLESGRSDQAKALWIRAAAATSWNDHQSERLSRLVALLDRGAGAALAWHVGVAYFARTPVCAQLIVNVGRTLLAGAGVAEPQEIALRFATLRNGVLMREGGRSIAVGRIALKLCDLAAFSNQDPSLDERKRYVARYAFKTLLAGAIGPEAGQESERAYINNEGWFALTSTEEAEESPVELTAYAGLTAALPGVLLGVSAIGAIVFLSVSILGRIPGLTRFRIPGLGIVALLIGIGAWFVSQMVIIGVLVGATVLLQAVPTEGTEGRALRTLGTLFEIAVFSFAVVFGALVAFVLYGGTAPGSATLTLLGVPSDYVGPTHHMLAVCLLVVGLFLIVPPVWGAAHRVSTHQVLALMLRQLGAGIAVWCLVGAVATTPICLKLDSYVAKRLRPLQENEPLYYVNP